MAEKEKGTVNDLIGGARKWGLLLVLCLAIIFTLRWLKYGSDDRNSQDLAQKKVETQHTPNTIEIPIYSGRWSKPVYSTGPQDRIDWGVVEDDVGVITQINDTLLITQPPLSDELWAPIEGLGSINKMRFMIDPENTKRQRATITLTYLDR